MFSILILIIANIVFILFYLQVEPVYLRVSNKPIQITSCVINIGNTSNIFVSRRIPTFAELLRKSVYGFSKKIENSSNSIIGACLSPLMFISSPIRKWWSSILYVTSPVLMHVCTSHVF